MNLYAYCDNNAITRLDSHGDCWWAIAAVTGAIVGAASSISAQLLNTGKVDLTSVQKEFPHLKRELGGG